jgi:hypothetical protein
MGKYKNGILGAFSGKIGAVIGASWRGIDYMRGLPKISNKAPTTGQLTQRMKMSLLRGFLLEISEIIDICFQNYEQTSPMNGALSYNIKYSVSGEYPDAYIDFPNLVLSKGDLQGSWNPAVSSTEAQSIDFSWSNGPFSRLRDGEDQVLLIIYSQAKSSYVFLTSGGLRKDGTIRFTVEQAFSGDNVHCYLSFYSKELEMASTTEYLGEVTIM